MKILAITRREPGATSERIQALQTAEVKEVWSLMGEGFVREIYFDKGRPAVVLVLEADSIKVAKAKLDRLPMVVEKQIGFEFYQLGPYTQLATLFRA